MTPIKELYAHLQGPSLPPLLPCASLISLSFAAYEALGYVVDARLHHYAAGIAAAQRLGL